MKKIAAIIMCVCSFLFTSCDYGLEIVDLQLKKLPEKTVYIIGKDSELMLDGIEIVAITRDGGYDICKLNDHRENWKYTIKANVDFTRPGLYVITIKRHKSSCSFVIQVCYDSRPKAVPETGV